MNPNRVRRRPANKNKVLVKNKFPVTFKKEPRSLLGSVPVPLGIGHQIAKGGRSIKYSDVNVTASSMTTAGTVTPITVIGQGVTVTQRVGDTAFLERLYINFDINAANSDVFTTARVMIFQWLVNTDLHVPVIADILQGGLLTLSMMNYQHSNQFHVLFDRLFTLTGLATAPTVGSLIAYSGEVSLAPAKKALEFTPAATTGSNQLFIMYLSDSALAPFPALNYTIRVMFDEEV